jgi:uncharacterized membrane protein
MLRRLSAMPPREFWKWLLYALILIMPGTLILLPLVVWIGRLFKRAEAAVLPTDGTALPEG